MGDRLGTIQQVWRYPVKSLQGERLTGIAVDRRGVVRDREWAVITRGGKLGSGKDTRRFERVDGLFDLRVRTSSDKVLVSYGGAEAEAGTLAADQLVSRAVGRDVELARETDVAHHDDGPLHLVTTSSLTWLAHRLGDDAAAVRRFRPNLVIDTGDEPELTEQSWVGSRLTVGGVTLEISHATVRCRMVTLPQPDGLEADGRVLRRLGQENEAVLGVYADVVEPGRISEDDLVARLT